MVRDETNGDGAVMPRRTGRLAAGVRLVARLVRYWALAGGVLLTGLAVMTALSAGSNIAFSVPFPADHELVKHFVAIVIFMFLPYCQLAGANVTVDIFTEGMSAGAKAAMALFSAIFAAAFALLLLRQMSYGFGSYIQYPEVTPVLKLPLWTAFPPILLSLALLFLAAVVTILDGVAGMRGQPKWTEDTSATASE